MSQSPTLKDDEIDLRELLAALWSHKLLIAFFTGISVFLAGHYALTTQKKYTARAIFQIEQENSSGFNITSEIGSLATLAGLATGSSSSIKSLLERIDGREFILTASKKFSLSSDPHFNSFNPDYKGPLWKRTIKKIIGWKSTEADTDALIKTLIISNYKKSVEISDTIVGQFQFLLPIQNRKKLPNMLTY